MTEQERVNRIYSRYPERHATFSAKPIVSRRGFLQVLGAGVAGTFAASHLDAAETKVQANVTTINKSKNVIFILLTGAISHTDTFDLKVVNGVTPSNFQPTMVNSVNWPMGLLPKIGGQLPNVAIVRSMYAHALVHNLA